MWSKVVILTSENSNNIKTSILLMNYITDINSILYNFFCVYVGSLWHCYINTFFVLQYHMSKIYEKIKISNHNWLLSVNYIIMRRYRERDKNVEATISCIAGLFSTTSSQEISFITNEKNIEISRIIKRYVRSM